MIKIYKSKKTKLIYIETVTFGASEDFYFIRDGDLFTIDRKNTKITEVRKARYDIFEGIGEDGELLIFDSPDKFQLYLEKMLINYKIITEPELEEYVFQNTYKPNIEVSTTTISEKPINSTFTEVIKGKFMDAINSIEISAPNMDGVSANISRNSYEELELNISTNELIQSYSIVLKRGIEVVKTFTFNTANLILIIPSPNGTSESLWRQPNPVPSNNVCDLTFGKFQSEQNNGNGWNDHAYYGGFSGNFNKIVHEFKVDISTNAYCHIRFNSTTNPSTSGGPRIYQSNGNNLLIYNQLGSTIGSTTIAVGDIIRVEFTPTTMEVFKNNNQVLINQGNYITAMIGSYVNFTSYRFSTFSEIKTKIFE